MIFVALICFFLAGFCGVLCAKRWLEDVDSYPGYIPPTRTAITFLYGLGCPFFFVLFTTIMWNS
jgi:hypothetical protein